MTNTQLRVDIKPRGMESAVIDAPFDKGKEALEKEGYHIPSLKENAQLRMQEGKEADVFKNGNWVLEDAIYVPDKGKFLTRVSHILANAKDATNCHRSGRDFYLTPEQVEQCLADSVSISGVNGIPTNRFGEDKIAVYAFGEDAKRFGETLKEAGIDEMPIWTADIQEIPFARKAWFYGLGSRSELGCYCRVLDSDDRVRGVKNSAEGTAKISENYTAQIKRVLKDLNLSGLEGIILPKLSE